MFRKLVHFVLLLIVIAVAIVGVSLHVAATRWQTKAAAEVDIPPGMSLRAIGNLLEAKGVIRTPKLFEAYVRVKGFGDKLKAGTYDFPAGTTMISAIGMLVKGDVRQYDFTVIEGWTIKDIAEALAGKPYLADENVPKEFERLAKDEEFIRELGFEDVSSLEGYLFPDTYRVGYPLEAKPFITRLARRFDEVWGSLDKGDGKMSRPEVMTLASIVEKETAVADERPLIAGLFMNRLKENIALQSDPTIIYGLPHFDGNIKKGDISNPHPYNTYVHLGLPPGPICNPGKASIEAVLHPEVSDYLYFVSKNDGTHFFSSNLSDHLKAVRRYQIVGEGKD